MPKFAQKMAAIAAAQLVTNIASSALTGMSQKPSGQTGGLPPALQAGHNQYQAYPPPNNYAGQLPGGYGTQSQGHYGQSYPQHQQSNTPPYPQGNSYPNSSAYPNSSGGQHSTSSAPGDRPTPHELDYYRALLRHTVQRNKLENFYREGQGRFEEVMRILETEGNNKIQRLMTECNVPKEIAIDMLQLILFDVILFVDDSGSIEFEEKGLRKNQLIKILNSVATAAAITDQDGISVRFMNASPDHDANANGIRNVEDVERLMKPIRFEKGTPLGTSLKRKVVDPMVVQPARGNRLQKPVLVITITDGAPVGEPLNSLQKTVQYAFDELSRTASGPKAVTFQFAQVGTDQDAHEFLGDLDKNPEIGHLVDCTSHYELEQQEMLRANPPFNLTPEVWRAKLMLGSIDYEYDNKDESNNPSALQKPQLPSGGFGGYLGGGQSQSSYGVPPQNQASYGPASGAPAGPSQGQYTQYNQAPSYGQPAYGQSSQYDQYDQYSQYGQTSSYGHSGAQGQPAYDQYSQYNQAPNYGQPAYGDSNQYSQYNQTPSYGQPPGQPAYGHSYQYDQTPSYGQPGAQGQPSQGYSGYGPQY